MPATVTNIADTQVENTATINKRGRKVGQKVASLDFRAFLILDEIDFAAYAEREDVGTKGWQREIVKEILERLRDGDDPIF